MRWLIFFVTFPSLSFAQTHSISAEFGTGKTLRIFNNFPERNLTNCAVVSWNKDNDTTNISSKLWLLPETGFSLSLLDFGNNETLGQGIGLQYHFGKKISATKKSLFLVVTKLGGIYFNRPFHYLTNTENIIIGSSFAFWVSLHFKYERYISQRLKATVSFDFYHSSNSHTNLPNVGYNIPMLSMGLSYSPKEGHSRITRNAAMYKKKGAAQVFAKSSSWHKQVKIGLGVNEFGGTAIPVNGPKFFFYTAGLSAIKRVKYNSSLQLGIEGYYSEEQRLYLETESHIAPPSTFLNASSAFVFAAYEFHYKHFGLNVMGGVYFHNPFDWWRARHFEVNKTGEVLKGYVPGRFGVKYYLKNLYKPYKKNAFVGCFVKSNVGQADFLELMTGFIF